MNKSVCDCLQQSHIIALGSWRADGAFVDANDALLGILRCKREDIEARRIRWPEITPAQYEPLDRQALQEIQSRGECTPFAKEYIRIDGSRVPVLIGAAAFGNGINDAGAFFVIELN